MAKYKVRRSKTVSPKKKAWEWCSRYIRLRDAVEYHRRNPGTPLGYVACCSCGAIVYWNKNCDAGHYISRGMGGSSGVYFDERNIHAQCKACNAWAQGNAIAYGKFMLERYGKLVVDELWLLHNTRLITAKEIIGYELYYKAAYKDLEKYYLKGRRLYERGNSSCGI